MYTASTALAPVSAPQLSAQDGKTDIPEGAAAAAGAVDGTGGVDGAPDGTGQGAQQHQRTRRGNRSRGGRGRGHGNGNGNANANGAAAGFAGKSAMSFHAVCIVVKLLKGMLAPLDMCTSRDVWHAGQPGMYGDHQGRMPSNAPMGTLAYAVPQSFDADGNGFYSKSSRYDNEGVRCVNSSE